MAGVFVQVRNLTRTVPSRTGSGKVTILDDVSVDFHKGEVTALIGPSGCGKSTLLKAICGIEQADAPKGRGEGVFFNGRSYYDNIDEFSHCIAYLPQFDSEWLHDELPVSLEQEFTWRLRDTGVSPVNLRGKADRDGYIYDKQHKLKLIAKRGDRLASLSGGQKKRAAIIAATLACPQLLLLDEPTAPLDPGSSAELIKDLVQDAHANDLTTIIVTHDPIALQGLGDDCHVVLMKRAGGRIGFDGTYRQLGAILREHYKVDDVESGLQQLFVDFSNNADLGFLEGAPKPRLREVVPGEMATGRPLGWLGQFCLLFRREFSLLRNKGASLLTLLAIPLVLGLILGLVVNKDEIYASYDMTKAMMFSLSACAFFAGVFDSIGAFSNKARIRVEELHGLRAGPYVLAVAAAMTILCFVQALIIFTVFTSLAGLPESILYDAGMDMFVTAFLCALSAAMLGMLCSSLFSNSTYIAPVLVVIQIVFSGMIFTLDGVTKWVSNFVSCHWAMNALAALCNLNSLPVEVDVPNIGETSIYYSNAEFEPERFTLFSSWLMLALLALGALFLCLLVMSASRKALFHSNYAGMRLAGSVMGWVRGMRVVVVPVAALIAIVAVVHFVRSGVNLDPRDFFGGLFDYLGMVLSDLPGFFSRIFSAD